MKRCLFTIAVCALAAFLPSQSSAMLQWGNCRSAASEVRALVESSLAPQPVEYVLIVYADGNTLHGAICRNDPVNNHDALGEEFRSLLGQTFAYDPSTGEFMPVSSPSYLAPISRTFGPQFLVWEKYTRSSINQLIMGDYSDTQPTLMGTGLQVGTGIIGIDLPADLRDLFRDIEKWQWSWGHAGKTTLDSLAMLPLIGALKYADEAAVILKHSDESVYIVKGSRKIRGVYDVAEYKPSVSGLEGHHGVLDVWAKHNVPGYVSRAPDNPILRFANEQHDATKRVYREWLQQRTGKAVGGHVDWFQVSPREIQELAQEMFDAADVPQAARDAYFGMFHKYIYRK